MPNPAKRWTGPLDTDVLPNSVTLLAPVPPDRWPYGPADAHEPCCYLHRGGLFCDCEASAETDGGDRW